MKTILLMSVILNEKLTVSKLRSFSFIGNISPIQTSTVERNVATAYKYVRTGILKQILNRSSSYMRWTN